MGHWFASVVRPAPTVRTPSRSKRLLMERLQQPLPVRRRVRGQSIRQPGASFHLAVRHPKQELDRAPEPKDVSRCQSDRRRHSGTARGRRRRCLHPRAGRQLLLRRALGPGHDSRLVQPDRTRLPQEPPRVHPPRLHERCRGVACGRNRSRQGRRVPQHHRGGSASERRILRASGWRSRLRPRLG